MCPTNPTIRPAVTNDAAAINAVSKHLGYSELSDAEEKLHQLVLSKTDEIYVAESSGRLVGWLHLFYARRLASDDFYEIGGLVVDPSYRKVGVGSALINYVENKHKGKLRVRCNESRLDAHKFYVACGFAETKVQLIFEKTT